MAPTFLIADAVVSFHASVIEAYGGTFGVRDESLLKSALTRAENKFFYDEPTPDVYILAASYAFGISKNHAFHDGNKRTAWGACVAFLKLNGVTFQASDRDRENRIVDLATGVISEEHFANWLRDSGCYAHFWTANAP